MNTKENDLMILRQLYNGNHLNEAEKERAFKLLHLLNTELKGRV